MSPPTPPSVALVSSFSRTRSLGHGRDTASSVACERPVSVAGVQSSIDLKAYDRQTEKCDLRRTSERPAPTLDIDVEIAPRMLVERVVLVPDDPRLDEH